MAAARLEAPWRRRFAREGARVFVTGRSAAKLDRLAGEITAAGGRVETATFDVFDQDAANAHAAAIAVKAGGIDIALNAMGFEHITGRPSMRSHPMPSCSRSINFSAHSSSRRNRSMKIHDILKPIHRSRVGITEADGLDSADSRAGARLAG
jgi:NAD(P)-dependent dehydrogenase (short-subunit alcohol dehydrogenase family)